jgi:hypothetical protein
MIRRTRIQQQPPVAGSTEQDVRSGRAVHSGLRSPSIPLDAAATEVLPSAPLDHDFSQVRVHANDQAAASAHALGARAWTAGRDIVFGANQYAPGTSAGRQLLAHELAHAVQQGGQVADSAADVDLGPHDHLEREARQAATRDGALPFAFGRLGHPALQLADGEEDVPPPPEAQPAPAAAVPEIDPLSGDTQLTTEQAMAQIYERQDAIDALRDEIVQVLLPAYRKAVDALDAEGAAQLATAAIAGLGEVERRRDALANKVGGWRSSAAGDPVSVGEAPESFDDIEVDVDTEIGFTDDAVAQLKRDMFIEMGPQLFRESEVVRLALPAGTPSRDYISSEAGTVIALIATSREVMRMLGEDSTKAAPMTRMEAARKVGEWRSRPVNIRFLERVLTDEGVWNQIASFPAVGMQPLTGVLADAREQAAETGNLMDVGTFDADQANDLLSRGATDWAISDEDAMSVFKMVMSAPRDSRQALMEQLDRAGKFDRLIENLPWKAVQALHDSIAVRGGEMTSLRQRMADRIADESGGESLSKVYERNIMSNIEDDDLLDAYGWTFLKTAHSALTLGFLDIHDAAYDARQEGYISSDAYWSTTTKAAARSAIIMAATAATGGAAGAFAEGSALGLGASQTTATLIGAGVGGGVSGISGQFTGDVFDQAFLGKEGFSSFEDYALAGAMGAGTGLLTGGLQAAGAKYLPNSAKTMAQVYGERYPKLDNVLTRIRGSGVRTGMRVRVTGQELVELSKAGLLGTANLQDSLDRIGAVYKNDRIDITAETMSKIHPQSDIERMYGTVDPITGDVTVTNPNPTSAGFAGKSSDLSPAARSSDASVRQSLGIDNPAFGPYQKYYSGEPLFEVVFRTSAELDVPLPQQNAPGVPLGRTDPTTHHNVGTGRAGSGPTGGVAEGELVRGAPIEIVEIRSVGDAHAGFPSTGTPYSPFAPAAPTVRNLPAPVSGATSGPTSTADWRDDE